jgi:hypothetical protein
VARVYKRDKLGRFASSGYSGQSSGRGARLTGSGNRDGGGARMQAARPSGTLSRSGKPSAKAKAPAQARNKITASPRRLDSAESAYVQILSQKSKFRSDAKRRAELSRRIGRTVSQNDALKISQSALSKLGVAPNTLPSPAARKAAISKYVGSVGKKPRRR